MILITFTPHLVFFFFFNNTAPTEIYTLPLHDALPIPHRRSERPDRAPAARSSSWPRAPPTRDRKSTRLNSSHLVISYAVFCLKKKKKSNSLSVDTKYLTEPTGIVRILCGVYWVCYVVA